MSRNRLILKVIAEGIALCLFGMAIQQFIIFPMRHPPTAETPEIVTQKVVAYLCSVDYQNCAQSTRFEGYVYLRGSIAGVGNTLTQSTHNGRAQFDLPSDGMTNPQVSFVLPGCGSSTAYLTWREKYSHWEARFNIDCSD